MSKRDRTVEVEDRRKVRPVWGVLWLGISLLTAPASAASDAPANRELNGGDSLVGSANCRSCHEEFYRKWATSRHGTAMQPYSPEFARAHLTPMADALVIEGSRFQADLSGTNGLVREFGQGQEKRFPIEQVLGGKNVYYFLTRLERGRLQTLPLAYDVRRKEWFDTAASGMRHFPGVTNELVHWTEPPYTFNTSCNSCHVSQLARNYDPATDSYNTTWREPGINCETCHGPGAEHIRVCLEAGDTPPKDLKIVRTSELSRQQRDDQCCSCHAKSAALSETFPPGANFHDHFSLITLESPDYYPDGRDLGENYTYTSWRQSPCLKSEQFECLHCHTSSGRFRFADNPNAACLPCHEKRAAEIAAHSHHKPGTGAPYCISCHMPKTEFARMERSDHSMRPPTPSATLRFGSPNACNLCHTDKKPEWADAEVRRWHTNDYQAAVVARASLVQAARNGDWSKLPAILEYVARPDRDEIFAASLLRLSRSAPNPHMWATFRNCLQDPSPLVRAAAVSGLEEDLSSDPTRTLLVRTLDDPTRVVRLAAAAALAAFPLERLPGDARQKLEGGFADYEAMLLSRPDTSSAQYNLGNYNRNRGNTRAALAAFEKAAALDPLSVPPLVNASVLYAQVGDLTRAEAVLRRAVKVEPLNAAAQLNLGLLLAEREQPAEAERALRAALQADPSLSTAAYNLAVLVATKQPAEAVRLCQQAVNHNPQDPKYRFTLGFYQAQMGQTQAAILSLQEALRVAPGHMDSAALLGRLYELSGQKEHAVKQYESVLSQNPPPEVRAAVTRRLEKLRE